MNDKKIRYLTEGITKDIVSYLMEDEGLSMTEAIAPVLQFGNFHQAL